VHQRMKPFKWLLDSPHLMLVTKMSPEEFARRFGESVDRPHYIPTAGYTGSSRILGTLSGTNFKLQERCWYRNSGLPCFYGRVQPCASGSVITGSFSLNPIVKAIMVVWLSLALLFSAIGCVLTASALFEGSHKAIWGLVGALGAMVLLSLAALCMSVIGRKKEDMYLKFFNETFEASLVERKE
jgi:hypothetical protein